MGVRYVISREMKMTDNRCPKFTSGYKIISSKATSHKQRGFAFFWKEGHASFGVELACAITPNHLTFQLVTGYKQF
jgi:hypothetical protein